MNNNFGDVLSQEEVDALLKGLGNDTENVIEEHSFGVKAYDIGRQERIVRGRMPALELLQEKFNRNLRLAFFTLLKRTPEIITEYIKIQKYQNFIRGVVVPANYNIIQIKPFRGQSLLIFEPNLIFLLIDYLYGGTGSIHSRVEGREFSQIENKCIENIVNLTLTEFKKTWIGFYEIDPIFVRSEMNSQFAHIATTNEIVITISIIIDFGVTSGKVFLCIPYSSIETIKDLLYNTMSTDQLDTDNRWQSLLKDQLLNTVVSIHSDLATAHTTIAELTELETGSVLPLTLLDTNTLYVNQFPVFEGKIGITHQRYGFKVKAICKTWLEIES